MDRFDYEEFFVKLLENHKARFVEKRGDPEVDDDISYLCDFDDDPCLGYFIIDGNGRIEYTDYRGDSYDIRYVVSLGKCRDFMSYNTISFDGVNDIYLDYMEDAFAFATKHGGFNSLLLESITNDPNYDFIHNFGKEL